MKILLLILTFYVFQTHKVSAEEISSELSTEQTYSTENRKLKTAFNISAGITNFDDYSLLNQRLNEPNQSDIDTYTFELSFSRKDKPNRLFLRYQRSSGFYNASYVYNQLSVLYYFVNNPNLFIYLGYAANNYNIEYINPDDLSYNEIKETGNGLFIGADALIYRNIYFYVEHSAYSPVFIDEAKDLKLTLNGFSTGIKFKATF